MTGSSPLPPHRSFHFDLKRLMVLPRKKKRRFSSFGMPLASFNLRLIAAALDTMVLIFLFAGITPHIADLIAGPVHIDRQALEAVRASLLTPDEQKAEVTRIYAESGFFKHWMTEFMIQLVIYLTYSLAFWVIWSATPGKRLLRMRVVDAESGDFLTFNQAFKRTLGYVLSGGLAMLGFFWIALDKNRQGWHDRIAHTVVIFIPWRKDSAKPDENPLA